MPRSALLACLVALALVACGGTSPTPTTPTPTPAPAPPPVTPSVTITSRIISGGPGTPSQEWGFTATCNVTCTSYDWEFGDGSGGNPIAGTLDIVIQ